MKRSADKLFQDAKEACFVFFDQWNQVMHHENHMALVYKVCELIEISIVEPESLEQDLEECLAACIPFIVNVECSITEVVPLDTVFNCIHGKLLTELTWLAIHLGDPGGLGINQFAHDIVDVNIPPYFKGFVLELRHLISFGPLI